VFVLEVNAIPGWQGLQRTTGLDVAGAIVEHLERKVVEHTVHKADRARSGGRARAGDLAAEFPV
jgi:ribosomal protein S6--L-glutamate ligase